MNVYKGHSLGHCVPGAEDFDDVANDLCEHALRDAKSQLHPLLQTIGLERLDQRSEFLQSFKGALEQHIARKLVAWQPDVQAVFKYDETPLENLEPWDGSIHLLVKISRLSNRIKAIGTMLDNSLVKYLRQLGWPRVHTRQWVLDIQQVTLNELRHGIGYGAMFYAVYTAPVKIWPQNGQTW
jgi:hypothetical protein